MSFVAFWLSEVDGVFVEMTSSGKNPQMSTTKGNRSCVTCDEQEEARSLAGGGDYVGRDGEQATIVMRYGRNL